MELELAPQFIQDIDWELFKKQRLDVLDITEILEEEKRQAYKNGYEEYSEVIDEQIKSLIGLTHLFDSICEYAIDICDIPENKVLIKP